MTIYLGIDVGTTAVKVLAIDGAGHVLAQASREYTYQTPQPGWVEQDAEDWWRLLCECVREVTSDCGAGACTPPDVSAPDTTRRGTSPRPTVAALALSTQGDTVVPLDTEGKPLAPAITWMDTRALPLVAEMEGEHELWVRTTGAAPAAFSSATSIAWWRRERPEVFSRARRFALVADFLNARLTGRYLLDAPNASRTMLYDIVRREWSPELLQRVGVGVERLPEAAESGIVVGTVLPEVAADLGLSPETQVVLGGHDQTCAAIGCGVIAPGSLLLSCGTAWVVLAATDGPVWDDQESLHGYCHAVPGGYVSLGAFAGGNLLRWFRDEFWSGSGYAAYDAITAEAAQAQAEGRPPLIFLPHFYGGSGPVRCPEALGGWAGLRLSHTRGDLALALLQGVALQAASCVESLARQGAPVEQVRMIGGGARSRFWTQLVADAIQRPVALPEVGEAAAFGAALLAATTAGAFASLEEAAGAVSIAAEVLPQSPADPVAMERATKLMASLTPVWKQLAGGD